MAGPMSGIRVIDLGAMIAGPAAATVLCDQGADVIKVEPTGVGDVMRYLGATLNGVSSLYHNCNRGKRSLALNLKSEEGVALLKELVAGADVVVENFRPGVTARLGIDYPSMSAVNPELVYLSVCGFGDRGPYADKAAYDNVIQNFAGVVQSQRDRDTGEPQFYQQLFCDKVTALTGAQAISAALLARERGSGGQHIRLSMVDSVVSFLWADVAGTRSFEEEGAYEGIKIAGGMRLLTFKDGYGTASPVTDSQFHGYCKAFGVDSADERFATVADRNANASDLIDIMKSVSDRALEMNAADAIAALEAEDVPCSVAQDLADLPEHPQFQANDSFGAIDNPQAGKMCEPNNPPNFSATPSDALRPAAQLGEHTDQVLLEIGKSAEEVAALREAGVAA